MAVVKNDDGPLSERQILDHRPQVQVGLPPLRQGESGKESLKPLSATMPLEAHSNCNRGEPRIEQFGISKLRDSIARDQIGVVDHILGVVPNE